MPLRIILRGGGDLASGVAYRLARAGLPPVITELPRPLVVRRMVSFAEAVYSGEVKIEGVTARRAWSPAEALSMLEKDQIPVLVDPQLDSLDFFLSGPGGPEATVLIDGRMTKHPPEIGIEAADLVIGLGPGFIAGENCHAVIETNRGHRMGVVIWQGEAEQDTGVPEKVGTLGSGRVLRAPAEGVLENLVDIGDRLVTGQPVAKTGDCLVLAPFDGVLRGLLHGGLPVYQGMKIGDLDPRGDLRYCYQISDKALAVGGGVLEALLSRPDLRPYLWDCHAPGSSAAA